MSDSTTFGSITAQMPARDVDEAVRFYVEKLGFTEQWRDGDPVAQASVVRDGAPVILFRCDIPVVREWSAFRVRIDGGLQAFYDRCRAHGIVHPNGPLTRKPWSADEFAVLDPGGVCITFWQPAAT